MTSLERQLNKNNMQPSDNPTNQASHAAAPEAHNTGIDGGHVVLVIAVFMIVIYGLKVLGRVMKSGK